MGARASANVIRRAESAGIWSWWDSVWLLSWWLSPDGPGEVFPVRPRPVCERLRVGRPYVRILLMANVRVTLAVARVLREFLCDPCKPRYGYELMGLTRFPSGKLYPVLARLVDAGWLIREREDVDASAAGRPARYLYRLSEQGAVAAQRELTGLSEQLAPPPQPLRLLPDRART
jgi:PadR family transcriptional regulator, regulatory protein PadR